MSGVTDARREALAEHWKVFRKHMPVGAYLPVGQLDGDCRECGGSWPCDVVSEVLAAWSEQDRATGAAEVVARVERFADALSTAIRIEQLGDEDHGAGLLAAVQTDLRAALKADPHA